MIQRWGSRHERQQGAGVGVGLTKMPMSGSGTAGSADDHDPGDAFDGGDQRG